MGIAAKPSQVKLFLAIVYSKDTDKERALSKFAEKFGDIERRYGPVDFTVFTSYYNEEMGEALKKEYITFKKLIAPNDICSIKTFTNKIEKQYMNNGRRTVNLDPGYINNNKLVLATTKNFFHRIYLDKGIYAEVTLHYRKGRYRYFSWTYPDYKGKEIQSFLEKTRADFIREKK